MNYFHSTLFALTPIGQRLGFLLIFEVWAWNSCVPNSVLVDELRMTMEPASVYRVMYMTLNPG